MGYSLRSMAQIHLIVLCYPYIWKSFRRYCCSSWLRRQQRRCAQHLRTAVIVIAPLKFYRPCFVCLGTDTSVRMRSILGRDATTHPACAGTAFRRLRARCPRHRAPPCGCPQLPRSPFCVHCCRHCQIHKKTFSHGKHHHFLRQHCNGRACNIHSVQVPATPVCHCAEGVRFYHCTLCASKGHP